MSPQRKDKSPSQSEKFAEAARSLGCDEDPAHFDEALKKVARHKPSKTAPAREKPTKKTVST